MTTTNVSPSSTIGETWTQIEDRFLVGSGSYFTLDSTGGHKRYMSSETFAGVDKTEFLFYANTTNTDTGINTPGHDYRIRLNLPSANNGLTDDQYLDYGVALAGTDDGSLCNTAASNTCPPYFVINIYYRTA